MSDKLDFSYTAEIPPLTLQFECKACLSVKLSTCLWSHKVAASAAQIYCSVNMCGHLHVGLLSFHFPSNFLATQYWELSKW